MSEQSIADAAWNDSEPTPVPFSAGQWGFELCGDEIADVLFNGSLVLRSVRAVARDSDWETVPPRVTEVQHTENGLEVSLILEGLGALLECVLSVRAQAHALEVGFVAVSRTDFDRNRIGLVVLHPPTVAGAALSVVSPDGTAVATRFPEHIAPHQPALDIAALAWNARGIDCELAFAGDVFEMEDQRNWTDASFKTYSTPLSVPFPVRVRAGDTIRQSMTLRCDGMPPAAVSTPTPRLVAAGRPAPSLGLGASTAPGQPPSVFATDHVLVELECDSAAWRQALERASAEAGAAPLDVRIVASSAAQVGEVLDSLAGVHVVRVGVFSVATGVSELSLWDALVAGMASRDIHAEALGGTRAHFTELNRNRVTAPTALAFSITPQMHAVERAQLVESIAMQRLVARDAVLIAAGRPVHIGPVTLRARYNAVATTPPRRPDDLSAGYGAELVPGATDERQRSEALAAWTIASFAALAIAGVASITWFETWGPRGMVDAKGHPYPVSTAIGWICEASGRELLAIEGELPPELHVIGFEGEHGAVLLAANLAPRPRQLRLLLPDGERLELELAPFESVRHALPNNHQ